MFDADESEASGEFESGGSESGGGSEVVAGRSMSRSALGAGNSDGDKGFADERNIKAGGGRNTKISSRPTSSFAFKSSAAAPKSSQPANYKVNDKISHARWGGGTILEVIGGGESEEIVVDFPSVGQKRLLANVAPIEKV